ncbi:MAG: ATP-binding protein [Gammaproteobacteria bacterium]|nr:ATP-binding protein [Gammaproteobacteria bacterium]
MPAPALLLTLKNDLSELSRIAEEIESHGESCGWPTKWILNLNLSLDELITNTVSYGYQDMDEHEIRVMLTEQNGALVAIVEDDGLAFDPFTAAPVPDLEADVENRPIGGLGVYFVKTLMDEVAYERIEDCNRITLIQRTPE